VASAGRAAVPRGEGPKEVAPLGVAQESSPGPGHIDTHSGEAAAHIGSHLAKDRVPPELRVPSSSSVHPHPISPSLACMAVRLPTPAGMAVQVFVLDISFLLLC
jgi:hypothetical protein